VATDGTAGQGDDGTQDLPETEPQETVVGGTAKRARQRGKNWTAHECVAAVWACIAASDYEQQQGL